MHLFLLLACAPSDKDALTIADTALPDTDPGDTGDPDDSSETDETGDTSETDGLRTFATCGGTVGDGVPAFYEAFLCVQITASAGAVTIATEDLPPYATAYYPDDDPNWAPWDDRGGTHHENPNTLTAQSMFMTLPAAPVAKGLVIDETLVDLEGGSSDEEYRGSMLGVGVDGVAWYHAVAAPQDDILQEQYTFDAWDGHPDDRGSYHHHGAARGALASLVAQGTVTTDTPGEAELELYGIMCDGTVLLGCTELDGGAPDPADFDAQNGHVHDLVDRGGATAFTERYHVHMCEALGRYGLGPEIQYYEVCGSGPPER